MNRYKNRIDVILEELDQFLDEEKDFINDIKNIKDEDLTEHQKERINILYVKA